MTKEIKKNKKVAKNNKQMILIILFILIITASIVSIIVMLTKKDVENEFKIDGIDIVDNQNILKDTEIEGLSITNQVLYTRNNISTFEGIVTNKTSNIYNIKSLYVVFTIDNEEVKSLVLKNTKMEVDKSLNINVSFDRDMSKVTKINYIIEK